MPEPECVSVELDRLARLIGTPGSGGRRSKAAVENAVVAAAREIASGAGLDVQAAVPDLVDDPQFRLAGAEDMLRQFQTTTERLIESYHLTMEEQDKKAKLAFDFLAQYAHFQKGMRKPTAAEFGEALRRFPKAQLQALTARHIVAVYNPLRKVLTEQLNAISTARQQLELANQSTPTIDSLIIAQRPLGARVLLPAGCNGVGQAIELFLGMMADSDWSEIDRRVQLWLEPKYGTVFQACLNSNTGPEDVLKAVHEEARAHINAKLDVARSGAVDFAAMFQERFRTPRAAEQAVEETFHEAEPSWIGAGPWVGSEVTVVSCPGGREGEALRELARRAIPVAGLPFADTFDALKVYREWPGIPVAVAAARRRGGHHGLPGRRERAAMHAARPRRCRDVDRDRCAVSSAVTSPRRTCRSSSACRSRPA